MIKEETQLFAQQRKPYTAPTMRVILLMGEGEIMIGSTPDNWAPKMEMDWEMDWEEVDKKPDNFWHFEYGDNM